MNDAMDRRARVFDELAVVGKAFGSAKRLELVDLLAQPGGVDHHAPEAARQQGFHGPLHQGFAVHVQQGFGRRIGEWAHAHAASGSEHHGRGPGGWG